MKNLPASMRLIQLPINNLTRVGSFYTKKIKEHFDGKAVTGDILNNKAAGISEVIFYIDMGINFNALIYCTENNIKARFNSVIYGEDVANRIMALRSDVRNNVLLKLERLTFDFIVVQIRAVKEAEDSINDSLDRFGSDVKIKLNH